MSALFIKDLVKLKCRVRLENCAPLKPKQWALLLSNDCMLLEGVVVLHLKDQRDRARYQLLLTI